MRMLVARRADQHQILDVGVIGEGLEAIDHHAISVPTNESMLTSPVKQEHPSSFFCPSNADTSFFMYFLQFSSDKRT